MTTSTKKTNFIRHIIDGDLASSKHEGKVITRFPPEPNGYLHIGHAKSICLNFGIAADYPNARCHLRFDDTNPEKEDQEYIDAIKRDVAWLGFDWGEHLYYASDYYERFYEAAVDLIRQGKAYVCSLTAEEVRAYRGTLTEPGRPSPDRDRSIEENLDLFARMRAGEFPDGQYTLRAKIDMNSGNINLRDPALYRIRQQHHPRTGDAWCIYPMYDFAHALSDAFEGITHSICTLEFQDHRPLYDWCVENTKMSCHPQQIEFARLNLNYTMTSKRRLKQLVDEKHVSGWDDPRLPTFAGMRRRGFTPAAIRNFCNELGVSKQESVIDVGLLEEAVRDDLNQKALRRMAVLHPIKVVLTNFNEDQEEELLLSNHPQQPELGKRGVKFTRELWIDADDFSLNPPADYFRLAPQREVRLLNSYVIRCDEVIQNEAGKILELRCTYLPETLGGQKPAHGGKVKGIIHWVSAKYALNAEVRLYERLFDVEHPSQEDDFLESLNPNSLQVIVGAKIEPCLIDLKAGESVQFNRLGYFCADLLDYRKDQPVFNRVVELRASNS